MLKVSFTILLFSLKWSSKRISDYCFDVTIPKDVRNIINFSSIHVDDDNSIVSIDIFNTNHVDDSIIYKRILLPMMIIVVILLGFFIAITSYR